MNTNNKTNYKLYNEDNITIEAHMQYYIDYANKLFYPSEVWIEGVQEGKWIVVKSQQFLGGDEYRYVVDFDKNGIFICGNSRFYGKQHKNDVYDQNQFKQIIKKEINKVNNLHGTTVKLINR
ncbi:hypothetical protein [Paenibacillus cremeus]|uniref:Uncharacterized protein n=1 Tax=Paenibacillus cremeus TaxID=2163881 RepID=A0A559KCH0_9BACL|nr:hypothetical protein [Paenibacillus cremeus]TVY09830.1 hypothetical protein FPZ49_10670 [Paenibacillus cremeus]